MPNWVFNTLTIQGPKQEIDSIKDRLNKPFTVLHDRWNIETQEMEVSETVYTEDDLFYNQHINKYLRFDPSLRRIVDDDIKCDKCDKPDIIIPIKYHPTQMKYLYVCNNCGNIFKTSSS